MFENIIDKEKNKFYNIPENVISEVEEKLDMVFPIELLEFYKEIGYGFLDSERGNFNRIMDPESICEFRFREGQFNNDSELEIYEEDEKDKIIFFEICEGIYLSIGFSEDNNGKIFYGQNMIAGSLKEFLIKYQENEQYYM